MIMKKHLQKIASSLFYKSNFLIILPSLILLFTFRTEVLYAQTAGTLQQSSPGFATTTRQLQLDVKDPEFPNASMVPPANFFNPMRPKLIILLHGATNTPNNPSSPKDQNGNPIIGTIKHPRYYWGFNFVNSLLGHSGYLYTFSNVRLNISNWPEGAYSTPLPRVYRLPTVAVPPEPRIKYTRVRKGPRQPTREYMQYIKHHYISTSSARRDLSLMLTHRDGSRSLSEQADKALEQIFEYYNIVFGGTNEPQIILVAHSMGGLVSRYILSNPYKSRSKNWIRANFIRNRTICLLTMATPHEGSPLADKLQQIANLVESKPPWVMNVMRPIGLEELGYNPRKLVIQVFGAEDPSIQDLKIQRLLQLNRSLMAPVKAARNDGTLIPIYAISGRDPSAGRLNRPHLPQISFGNDLRNKIDTAGLVLIDQAFKVLDSRGWKPPQSGSLDWIQRLSLNQLIATNKQEVNRILNKFENKCLKLIVNRLGGIIKTSGLRSFDFNFPVYLDRKWMVSVVWKNVAFKHWECGNFRFPWEDMKNFDLARVVQFLIKNMGYNLDQLAGCATDPNKWRLKNTIRIPTIGLAQGSARPSDNETDNDGMVGVNSGLAVKLGQNNVNYFDHTRQWPVGTNPNGTPRPGYGSWYRFYTGPWDKDNHGTILRNASVAQWIHQNIVRTAGPIAGPGSFSYYVIPRPTSAPALRPIQ
jgi:hypothetical protein